jgi:transcriptional regulator with XRE-family HTH domain
MEDITQKIGKRIFNLRKEIEGLSQEKLALKADIDRSYITDIEKGNRNISIVVLEKIVKALDTDFVSFFDDEMFRDAE